MPTVVLENALLRVEVAPDVGGRITSVVHKATGHEFLWRHPTLPLARQPQGAEYDPVFWGGIDELLPNDLPETVDGVALPDHGELWTAELEAVPRGDLLELRGRLPKSGLLYTRRMRLRVDRPELELGYRITNGSSDTRHVLFKLHAALACAPGDRIVCPAARALAVDPAYTRWRTRAPFAWPEVPGEGRADVVPPARGEIDFLYLYELARGEMAWTRPDAGLLFRYRFDPKVFPCAWLFASYGGFQGHETVILEPCTTMPISVAEAAARGVCTVLRPGETLDTTVSLFAGTVHDEGAA